MYPGSQKQVEAPAKQDHWAVITNYTYTHIHTHTHTYQVTQALADRDTFYVCGSYINNNRQFLQTAILLPELNSLCHTKNSYQKTCRYSSTTETIKGIHIAFYHSNRYLYTYCMCTHMHMHIAHTHTHTHVHTE